MTLIHSLTDGIQFDGLLSESFSIQGEEMPPTIF